MSDSIVDVSHGFFDEYVKPILAAGFPDEFAAMAFGVWGLGSEALKMDDEFSRDHHWGLRIDAIMPLELLQARWPAIQEALEARLPHSYQGHALGERLSRTCGAWSKEPALSSVSKNAGPTCGATPT